MRDRGAGPVLAVAALVLVSGCANVVPGAAQSPATPSQITGKPGATPELASTGPHIAAAKNPAGVDPCTMATRAQVTAALGVVTGAPSPLGGNTGSCVWPLDSGPKDGFLVGFGLGYADVVHSHPATRGSFERETDGNSTWLWCDVSAQTGAFTCGAAVAITADRTFVTGLVRAPGAGRTKTSVLSELQPITIALFRSLPRL